MDKDNVKIVFAERLQTLVEEKHYNKKEFSIKVGIPYSTVLDWLKVKHRQI